MGEMVDRVAKALLNHTNSSPGVMTQYDMMSENEARELASVAIAAMREPTEAMVQIGYAASNAHDHMPDDIRSAWSAMIDAALADGPVTEPTSQHSQGSSEHDHS